MVRFVCWMVPMVLTVTYILQSCSSSSDKDLMSSAESVMEEYPDSSLNILKGIDKASLKLKREQARFALLMSMALDKNYVDTTTFDVLQPAIDYYLNHGSVDDKLRTYYYQGCIYDNKGDYDHALKSFSRGISLLESEECEDSLTLGRAYIAKGRVYNRMRDFTSSMYSAFRAADIFHRLSRNENEYQSLLNALNAAVLSNNKIKADSALGVLESFKDIDKAQYANMLSHKLIYLDKYGTVEQITESLDSIKKSPQNDINGLLQIASAYDKIGCHDKSESILQRVKNSGHEYDTLKYLAISVGHFEGIKDYEKAYEAYCSFTRKSDSIKSRMNKYKTNAIIEKHEIEYQLLKDSKQKFKILYISGGLIVVLILGIIILSLIISRNRIRNKNLKLENYRKTLEAENLAHAIENLEGEKRVLERILDSSELLSKEVADEIRKRMEVLNSIIAGYISNNTKHEQPYEVWIKEITNDSEEFMIANKKAFQYSHPKFISYLKEHGLSEAEINYVCLYALGLNGREIGSYIRQPGHVNMSSIIRKKLGLDSHDTNLSIYIRRLIQSL